MSDRDVRDVFAYPFKVLRDIFTDPPFVPEPEFTRLDLNALRGEDSGGPSDVSHASKSARARRERIRIPMLLLALVLIVLALIILD